MYFKISAIEGRGRGIMVERRGRDQTKNMHGWPRDMDNSVGIDGRIGGEGVEWVEEGKGGKTGTIVIEKQQRWFN